MRNKIMCTSLLFFLSCLLHAQQVGDKEYQAEVSNPAWQKDKGPLVLVDEAHHNYHTMDARYKPFAEVLRADGYRVAANTRPFAQNSLPKSAVLVISNALNRQNLSSWKLPTPSAFTKNEIHAVRGWVEQGGNLFLIVDHMPMPGAAYDLARAFGVIFSNGFAMAPGEGGGILVFSREAGTLPKHPITEGRSGEERIDSVASFTGSAFRISPDVTAKPLLVFPTGVVSLEASVAWEFTEGTPEVMVTGWYQGAVMECGKGRVAIFGEAAMFTAQIQGSQRKLGLAHPVAKQNQAFLLNLMHWLARLI